MYMYIINPIAVHTLYNIILLVEHRTQASRRHLNIPLDTVPNSVVSRTPSQFKAVGYHIGGGSSTQLYVAPQVSSRQLGTTSEAVLRFSCTSHPKSVQGSWEPHWRRFLDSVVSRTSSQFKAVGNHIGGSS